MAPTNTNTPLSREEYVWTMAYCYALQQKDCTSSTIAIVRANAALEEFRRIFNSPIQELRLSKEDQQKKMTTIKTYSNIWLDLANPTTSMIHIEDIARGLSREPRYAGQSKHVITVAQHCVILSYLVTPNLALEALLHDATEAYMKDIPTPLKYMLPGYRKRGLVWT